MEENSNKPQIPRLETPQTQHIRASYPTIEYLEDGYVADWLKERKDQFLELAREERSGINANKLVSGAVLAAGFFFHAVSPLAPVGMVLGIIGYAHGCFIDASYTGSFSPFPFIRGNVLDLAGTLGNAELREKVNDDVDDFEQLQHYLSPVERKEYALIDKHFTLLTDYLTQVEPLKRFHAYRWIFDCFARFNGALPSPQQINNHMANVRADIRTDRTQLAALDQHRAYLEAKNRETRTIEQLNEYTPMPEVQVRFISDEQMGNVKPNLPEVKLSNEHTGDSTKFVEDLSHKHQWVNQILKLPFRVISGEQGSGKSTLERWMINLLKEAGYYIVVINPETNPSVWKGVTVLSTALEINEFFGEFIESVRDRQHEARVHGIDEDDYFDYVKGRKGKEGLVAIFLMESNTYEVHGVDPNLWADFLKQCLTNIRKWGFTACLTAHSDNQTSIASKLKGFSSLLDAQPRIDCVAIPDPRTGEATSSGKGFLRMKGTSDPNPQTIKLFNYPKTKDFRTEAEKEHEQRPMERKEAIQDVIDNLEKSFKIEVSEDSDRAKSTETTEEKVKSELSEPATRLLSFFNNAKNKEPKALSDIKKKDELREYGDIKLIIALQELVAASELFFDGEDRWMKSDW